MKTNTLILAVLIALASVGAYASTKSAAEGEVNTPVEALIPMAQDYVKNAGIDTDNSATINTDKELYSLLAGTISNSIEDLTAEDINKNMVEENANKKFITFMTTENAAQAKSNINSLEKNKDHITEMYDKFIEEIQWMPRNINMLIMALNFVKDILNQTDELTQENCDEIKDYLSEIITRNRNMVSSLNEINSKYEDMMGHVFVPIVIKNAKLGRLIYSASEQSSKITVGYKPTEEDKNELDEGIKQASLAMKEISDLKEHYEKQKENDIALLKMLLQQQAKFNEDGKSSAEEQAASKDLLNKLVENASPMTRNYIIKLAEEQYKPENDPTGIDDVVVSTKIKGNVYKTPTEIHVTNGMDVIVSDYSGKVLRIVPLNPATH